MHRAPYQDGEESTRTGAFVRPKTRTKEDEEDEVSMVCAQFNSHGVSSFIVKYDEALCLNGGMGVHTA